MRMRSDHPMPPPAPQPGRGRPRRPETDRVIHNAVVELLQTVGYAELSYEAVARHAGVSRPTLYRRAHTKAALVIAAITDRYGLDPVPDTGSLAEDLLALGRQQVRFYNDPVIAAAFPGLLADVNNDPAVADAWWNGFVAPRRETTLQALRRAQSRGELRSDVDVQWICEVVTGPLISSAFLGGHATVPENRARDTVDLVMSTYAVRR